MRFAALAIATLAGVAAAGTVSDTKAHGKGKADNAKAAAAAAAATTSAAAGADSSSNPAPFTYGKVTDTYPGVRSTNRNGPTNPKAPKLGTPINQTSVSRLASINSIDDWCTFGPAGTGQDIGDIEAETVAWCVQPRNNARVIPDGTLTAVHFVKTPLYVQIMALGDFTKIGLNPLDEGGELDPHGATNMGNPVGGNVTSNVTGQDVFYEEWMNYISYNQVCFRVCIAAGPGVSTAAECQHTLDVMGCNFVMPGNYADSVFETCDGDAAYPPGIYPQPDGSTSSFAQFFEGTYTGADGQVTSYTNGNSNQQTPSAAYSLPATSNCVPTGSIGNGIASLASAANSASATVTTAVTQVSGTMITTTRKIFPSSSGSGAASGGNSGAGVPRLGAGAGAGALLGSLLCAASALIAAAVIL
ncbi:hypothetical protein OC844_006575 [Tilletia horrida]|nr:hypothetical protein OC844_006575 [Tilletia horrida]